MDSGAIALDLEEGFGASHVGKFKLKRSKSQWILDQE